MLAISVAAGLFSTARAQQPHGPVHISSVAHGVTHPSNTSGAATSKKIFGPARVIPLHRPADTGLAIHGGGGEAGPAAPVVGNWADADVQATYSPSQLTVSNVFGGVNFTGQIPPDENLSVGINTTGANPVTQIVDVVNTSYTIFTSSGQGIKSDYLNGLFASLTSSMCSSVNGGDGIVLFDKLDGRWIISQLAYNSTFTDDHLCLAISQTSDATGAYDAYDFSFGSNLPDYPKLAIWPDGIYFSANMYSSNGSTLQFKGAEACSFPRGNVTNPPAGGQITFSCSSGSDAGIYNILPADLENLPGTVSLPSGSDYYMQYVENLGPGAGNDLRIYQFDPISGSLNIVNDLTVNDYHDACGGGTCIPQTGTTQQLDSLGDRLMYRLSYRAYGDHDQMVVNHSVQINSSDNQTGVRWYVIRRDQGGPFYVNKESTFSPDVSAYRWMASIAQNKNGDLGLGYSSSGVTSVPGIAVTGLKNGADTLMEQEQRMYNGSDQSYQGTYSRWGDYSSMSVDPTDDCSFWYTNEYSKPPVLSFDFLWNTVIGKLSFGDCSGSASPGFSLSANAPTTQTVTPGAGASYSITVTPASGYNGVVDLSVGSTCPTGATCSLSPSQIDFGASSTPVTTTLTANTSSSTTAQNYTVVVKGTDHATSSITSQTSVVLAVTDFSLTSNPSSQTVTAGTNASYTITANALNGFNGTVSLSVGSTCPAGLTCAFGSASISAGSSTTLTISGTSSVTTASTFTITVTGTAIGLTRTTTAGLTVNLSPNFSLSGSPGSQTVTAGAGTSYTVTITPSGGFSGSVTFSVSGLPSGATGAFTPNPGTTSSTLNITTGSSTPAGTSTLTITGTSGSLTHTTTVSLTVNPAPNFSLSATPGSQTVTAGTGASYTVNITPSGGFSGSVTLNASGFPSGVTVGFSPNPATSSSSMTVTTTASTAPGTYTLTITGTSGSLTHTATVSLTVNAPSSGNFSMSASPGSLTLKNGQRGSYTINVSPSGGFTGLVNLTVSGCPATTTCTVSPSAVNITGSSAASSQLTVVDNGAARNSNTLTITGKSAANPSLIHTVSVSLRTR